MKLTVDNAITTLKEVVKWHYLTRDFRRREAEIEQIIVHQVSDYHEVDIHGQLQQRRSF